MARTLLPLISASVGILLLLQVGYPLYAFAVDSINGGLNVAYTVEGDTLVVKLDYSVRVPFKNATITLSTDTGKEWSASDPSLESGESLELRVPLQELEGATRVTLRLEGSIAGLYRAGLEIEASVEAVGG